MEKVTLKDWLQKLLPNYTLDLTGFLKIPGSIVSVWRVAFRTIVRDASQ